MGWSAGWILAEGIISKNRRRYTENGFDLDLCYVTNRIIAMGYPAEGGQGKACCQSSKVDRPVAGFFRNSRSDVLRLLEMKHSKHYRVYNLCGEKQYDPQSLGGEVALFPFGDHQVRPAEFPFRLDMVGRHPRSDWPWSSARMRSSGYWPIQETSLWSTVRQAKVEQG